MIKIKQIETYLLLLAVSTHVSMGMIRQIIERIFMERTILSESIVVGLTLILMYFILKKTTEEKKRKKE